MRTQIGRKKKRTHAIIILEVLQVLVLILTKRLGDIWVFDHIEDGLRLLLQPLVRRHGLIPLCSEFYPSRISGQSRRKESGELSAPSGISVSGFNI